MLHATDDDPAGLKAAGRDYWLLTARGIDIRKLILTDGEQAFNDPADAYSAAPTSLTATLGAVDIAPSLAAHLIADTLSQRRQQLSDGNLYAVVGIARELGAMLADSANDDPSRYIELLTTTTNEAGRSWDRPTEEAPSAEQGNQAGHAELPGVSADETEDATTGSDLHSAASSIERVERFHQRLGRAAATLSALRQSEAKRIQPVSTDREQSGEAGVSETRTEQHRREEDWRRGIQLDEPERERSRIGCDVGAGGLAENCGVEIAVHRSPAVHNLSRPRGDRSAVSQSDRDFCIGRTISPAARRLFRRVGQGWTTADASTRAFAAAPSCCSRQPHVAPQPAIAVSSERHSGIGFRVENVGRGGGDGNAVRHDVRRERIHDRPALLVAQVALGGGGVLPRFRRRPAPAPNCHTRRFRGLLVLEPDLSDDSGVVGWPQRWGSPERLVADEDSVVAGRACRASAEDQVDAGPQR